MTASAIRITVDAGTAGDDGGAGAIAWASRQGIAVFLEIDDFQVFVRPGDDAGTLVGLLRDRRAQLSPAHDWLPDAYVIEAPRRAETERVARSVKDVVRLAPEPGAYWVRKPGCEFNAHWRISEMDVDDEGGRLWDAVYGAGCGLGGDKSLIGWEIVGPIAPPAD